MQTGRSIALLITAMWLAPDVAAAQRVVVVRSTVAGSMSYEEPVTAAMAQALERMSLDVVSGSALAAIVEQRVSREPAAVGADEVAALVAAVHELELLVATRRRESALLQAQLVRELSEGTVGALSEQQELGRTLVSGCLADAWLHIQMDEDDDARSRLLACREMHPDVLVPAHSTPPDVERLLAAIDSELAARPRLTVRIDGAPDGCDVLLNGRRFGTTPAPMTEVPMGHYQVELACPGFEHHRVHALVVTDEDRSFSLDPVLDDALHSSDLGYLAYRSAGEESAHHIDYAVRVAVAAGATEVIVVSPEGSMVRADRISLAHGVVASCLLPGVADAALAARALMAGQSLAYDETGMGRPPTPYHAWTQPMAREEPGREVTPAAVNGHDDTALIAGITLGGAGLLVFGGALAAFGSWTDFYGQRRSLDPMLSRYYVLSNQIEQTEWAGGFLGTIGAVMMIASVPLWLPGDGIDDVAQIPWWSWTLAGLGAVAIGVGSYLASVNGQEERSPNFATCNCLTTLLTMYDASLLWEAGSVALAIPVTHLLRIAIGPHAPSIQPSVAATQASLSISGIW